MGRRGHRNRRAAGLGVLAVAAASLAGCAGGHYHGSYYSSWGSYQGTCHAGGSFEGGTEDLWLFAPIVAVGAVLYWLTGEPY